MLRRIAALLLLAVVLAPAAHAQSLDDVLGKYFKAGGGLDKMQKVQTVRMIGKMQLGPGMEAPFVMDRKRPAKQRLDFTFSGMTGTQAYDGHSGWKLMPFMGQKTAEALTADESKTAANESDFDGPLLGWKEKGHTLELAGKEPVEGADAFKVKVTKKDGQVEYYYFDADTYLLVKREAKQYAQGTEYDTETLFGNYKETHGLMYPYSLTMGAKGIEQKQTLTIDSIAVDVSMDDAHFVMPAPPDTTKDAAKPKAK